MKHKLLISFTLLFLLIDNIGVAQQVTQTEAINAAINTMKYETRSNLDINSISTVHEKIVNNNTLLYEVTFGDGYVVLLSGNKSCIPVLGIIMLDEDVYPSSLLEGYDNPEALECFIDSYSEQVRYCFDNRVNGVAEQEEWSRLLQYDTSYYNNSRVPQVGPLISTKWGQHKSNGLIYDEHAYNYYVTKTGSYCDYTYCPAGCVAVAMAQVMRYWNHPSDNPSKCHQYDWNNMPNKLKKNNANYVTERNAVARLIRDCGQSVNMRYCYNGACFSGAFTDTIPLILDQFGYNNTIWLERRNYSNVQWGEMVRDNLNNGMPLIYSGDNIYGDGHTFICDGYKERMVGNGYLYSFNWGENGKDNGWFFIDNITTNFNGPILYYYSQSAVFSIYPTYCWNNIIMECDKTFPNTTAKYYCINNNFDNNHNSYIINPGAIVHIQAGNEVIISDGFYAAEGSDFLAEITTANSSRGDNSNNLRDNDKQENIYTEYQETIETTTSCEDSLSSVNIYPNPTKDVLNITFSNKEENIRQVQIASTMGTIMLNIANPTKYAIDINNIPSGLYIVKIITNKGNVYFEKILVER